MDALEGVRRGEPGLKPLVAHVGALVRPTRPVGEVEADFDALPDPTDYAGRIAPNGIDAAGWPTDCGQRPEPAVSMMDLVDAHPDVEHAGQPAHDRNAETLGHVVRLELFEGMLDVPPCGDI